MRNLADDLDVTPMAIYRHVDGRTDLLEAVIDHALESLGDPSAGESPDQILRHLDQRLHGAFGDLPEIALLLIRRGPRTARSVEFIDRVVSALVAAGLSVDDAAATYATVSTLALARIATPAAVTDHEDLYARHALAHRTLGHLTRSDANVVDAIVAAGAALDRAD